MGVIAAAALLVASIAMPFTVSAQKPAAATAAKPSTKTIAEIAIADGRFTTLVAALTCTGLVPAVSGTKQLTVFAPTDAAFAKLEITPENVCETEGLTDILLYHVTEGRRTSTSVLAAPSYSMLNGDKLMRSELSTAGIAIPNISAKNGVIHAINNVLLPN